MYCINFYLSVSKMYLQYQSKTGPFDCHTIIYYIIGLLLLSYALDGV